MDVCIQAPEGAEYSLTFFLTSDATGVNTTIALSGMEYVKQIDTNFDAAKSFDPLSLLADDWRPMTREEIAAYKAAEKEEADEE